MRRSGSSASRSRTPTVALPRPAPGSARRSTRVVLHAEVPVVDKDVEGVERVRLDTETVTNQETVTDEVRKERVDLDCRDATQTWGHTVASTPLQDRKSGLRFEVGIGVTPEPRRLAMSDA